MADGRSRNAEEMRKLFDQQRITCLQQKYSRQDLSDPRIPASVWLALDHEAAAERERLEILFHQYQEHLFKERNRAQDECESIIKRFLGRFHHQEDQHHLAAYYELEVFRLIKALDLDFSLEPTVPSSNKTPDFEIHNPRTYIEVATALDKADLEGTKKAYELIRHEINQIKHDRLRVSLHIQSVPSQLTDEDLNQVRKHTRLFIDEAEQDAIRVGEERTFGQPGLLRFSLKLVTTDAKERGPIVWLCPHLSFWVSAEQAKRAIRSKMPSGIKAINYEFLDHLSAGYIVAIGIGGISFTEFDIRDMVLNDVFNEPGMHRISGVLTIAASWDPQNVTRSCRFALIINPNARIPVGCELLSKLKTADVAIIKS